MRFYNKEKTYFWDIDRFHLLTESEKCALLQGIRDLHEIWKEIDESATGMTYMLFSLIEELEESIHQK